MHFLFLSQLSLSLSISLPVSFSFTLGKETLRAFGPVVRPKQQRRRPTNGGLPLPFEGAKTLSPS